ncbi:pentapeptide repeat-containing protein [Spirulina sp. CS-785/01]|uniref:pentapeptide repeat-containing protein n=1 Tax=Spirulina sp. CS-785/01 TaxID=3021716 RepID=UPI00232D0175|nr:pentapeptide repeat-containing protein [Spirulina sp. CS-785/01]MDB9315956.1 pentapeptide repeat-containing protein [Spirulina sp. CS-785/01]
MTTPSNPQPSNPSENQNTPPLAQLPATSEKFVIPQPQLRQNPSGDSLGTLVIITAITVMVLGWVLQIIPLLLAGALVTLLSSLRITLPAVQRWVIKFLTPSERKILIGTLGLLAASAGFAEFLGVFRQIQRWLQNNKWDEFGSWADWFGAVGQIMIAILAVYVAWQQYVISRDLTIRQNTITQQQTIDAYFQGISDLALSDEGLLEDWPQERAFAEGRTAAILSSVDAAGKAKILRFLSQSKLLTPLRRDGLLGRAILDGAGGYAEDRVHGLRVIDLGVMLARANLSGTDLRWTDLSAAYMIGADLSECDLVKANLARTVLYDATLRGADIKGIRLFYGHVEAATPRSLTLPPNYENGAHTGAVVERVDFTGVERMSEEQRYYCCCWGGEKTRATIPGGCEGIPNKLGR